MAVLTIAVALLNGAPVADPQRVDFGAQGGSIGRGTTSTLLLPDPDRLISRTHATIELRHGGFHILDQSSVSPVLLNDAALGHGRSAPLAVGDRIGIGRYVLAVERASADAPTDALAQADAAAEATISDSTLASKGAVLSWSDANGEPVPPDVIRTVLVPSPHGAEAPAATPDAAERHDATVDAPQRQVDAQTGTAATAEVPPTAPMPIPMPSAVATSTGAADSAAAASGSPQDELLRAFLRGAGVDTLQIPGGLTPELMRTLGRMLRESTQGLLDLLAARAMAKREVRADATIIVAQDNNPLKFSPTIEAALAHLLAPRGTGFMPPLRAVTDANSSLQSHQLAFMAGMQAALASVLKRLDPHVLEHEHKERSLFAALLGAAHRAQLWDRYTELHAAVTKDAETDFHGLFGREFLGAYQQKVTRLLEQDEHSQRT